MGFTPKLPTFNQQCRIVPLIAIAAGVPVWGPPGPEVDFQLYPFDKRTSLPLWLPDFFMSRGTYDPFGATTDWQEGMAWMMGMFPKEVELRDFTDLSQLGLYGRRDYIMYSNPNYSPPVRHYWIDQVEPRWAGFPNEHKVALLARKNVLHG